MKMLDVVALLDSLPEHGLERGMSGTVVEVFEDSFYEVEFSDERGRTFALVVLASDQLLKLVPVPIVTDEQLAQTSAKP
ncbi:MAG: DUF4926 domain-containing protein [Anaerolineae bacterium]